MDAMAEDAKLDKMSHVRITELWLRFINSVYNHQGFNYKFNLSQVELLFSYFPAAFSFQDMYRCSLSSNCCLIACNNPVILFFLFLHFEARDTNFWF